MSFSYSYTNNIKDGWNVRDYHHINERLCNGVSFLLNVTLCILLVKTKDQFMKAYSRVLLQNCIIDLIYTLTCALTEMQLEVNEGVYIFVVNGFFKEWPLYWHYILLWLYITTTNTTLLNVNIEFFFRYMLICKSVSLTTCQLTLLGLVPYILSGLSSSFAILALLGTPDHAATFGHLMRDPIWFDENGKQTIFAGAMRTNLFSLLFLASSAIYNAFSCGIIFWLGIATFHTLRQSRHAMSTSTKTLNTQMNRILALEAGSALFVINVPVGCLITALLFDINIVGFGIIMTMIFVWIPVTNPIVTILLVGPYRRAVFGWMRRFGRKEECMTHNMNHLKILELLIICG